MPAKCAEPYHILASPLAADFYMPQSLSSAVKCTAAGRTQPFRLTLLTVPNYTKGKTVKKCMASI